MNEYITKYNKGEVVHIRSKSTNSCKAGLPNTLVTVNNQDFSYTREGGLENSSVVQLTAYIRREAMKFLYCYPFSSVDLEDLIQEGHLGAIKAAKRFNPDHGVQFITYAAYSIRAAMREAIGEGVIHTPRGQKYVPVSLMDPQRLGSLEAFEPEGMAEGFERRDLYERALEQIKKLPEAKKCLVLRYIYGDETMAEIGKDLGVSRQRVSQILQAICGSLRAGLAA